ncbi:MAG: PAS domain S-box protein [Proteobacteria bacterium]|nr:PAS domain S-box protein [Pseudomonadota bacterium]
MFKSYTIHIATLAGVIILGLAAFFINSTVSRIVQQELEKSLVTVLQTARSGVRTWSRENQSAARIAAQDKEVRRLAGEFLAMSHLRDDLVRSPFQEEMRNQLRVVYEGMGYTGYFLIGLDKLSLSSMRDANVGKENLLAAQPKFLDSISAGETAISLPLLSDVPLRDSRERLVEGLPTMFVGAPITDDGGEVIAALVFRIDPGRDFAALLERGRIGETGETYAFDRNGLLLSPSRFDDQLRQAGLIGPDQVAMLNLEVRDPGVNLMERSRPGVAPEEMPLTRMALSAVEGAQGSDLDGYRNYRGAPVVGVWLWDDDLGMGLTTELDVSQARRFLNVLQMAIAAFTITAMGLLIALAVLFLFNRKREIGREYWVQQREARFSAILSTATEAIVTIDENGLIDLFNPAAEAMFGYQAEEVTGKNVEMLMPGNYQSKHNLSLARYLRTGETTVIGTGREVEGRRKDGSVFPVDLALAEWQTDGKTYFTGSMRDLTARVRMEGRLREAQKMEALGRLSGGVAHEFTNLLLPIIALTTSSISDLPENDKVAAKLKKVLQTAEHGRSILNQIMDFSRQRSVDRSKIELVDVIGEAIALLKVTLPPRIEVLFCSDGFDEIALADPVEIHQMISNLGINAAKAINKEPGRIEFRLQRLEIGKTHQKEPKELKPGRYAHLTVSDTGCGMNKDISAKIFEPFFTTRLEGEGTGMGLSIVHAIVTGHEGAISVESRPGEGTTFDIYLPLGELPVHEDKSSYDGIAYDDKEPAAAALITRKEESGAEAPAVDETRENKSPDTEPALE